MKTNFDLLYVEDDVETQIIYKKIFDKLFSKVIIASNGNEALSMIKNEKFDVAILDINLPDIDGLEIASKIKEINSNTYIIMLTAFDDKDKLMKSIKIHVNDYLLKPAKSKFLLEAINKAKNEIIEKNNMLFENNIYWNNSNSTLIFHEQKIDLTKKEIQLLHLLSSDINRIYSIDEILDYIWPDSAFTSMKNNSLSKLISRFKNKVKKTTGSECKIIENCYSYGYKLNTL